MPVYAVDQAAMDDPTGDLMSLGRLPGRWRAQGFRVIERLQTSGAKVLRDDWWLMQVLRRLRLSSPLFRAANGTMKWLKNRHFPLGIDSFLPRVSGSRSYYMGGRAVLDALDRLETQGRQLAAQTLGVGPQDLVVIEDGFAVSDAPSRTVSWATLASSQATGDIAAVGEAHLPRGQLLSASGNQVGPVDFMHASHGCDLAVNPDTGEVRILNYAACHDVGKIHDEHIIRGQLLGGIAMGIGQALLENVDAVDGIVRNQGMHEYGVPTSLDIPENITIDLVESGNGLGPGGAKGVGEAGAVVSPSAIVSALGDALGVEIESIPVMPEKIVALSGKIN
jgi:CO/xanthine dehydrogenase Mo-binding subunit